MLVRPTNLEVGKDDTPRGRSAGELTCVHHKPVLVRELGNQLIYEFPEVRAGQKCLVEEEDMEVSSVAEYFCQLLSAPDELCI